MCLTLSARTPGICPLSTNDCTRLAVSLRTDINGFRCGGVQTSTLLTSTVLRGPNDGEGLLCVCWPRHIPHKSSMDNISAVHTYPHHHRVVVPHHLPSTYHTLPLETHYILPDCTTRLKKSNAPPATQPPHTNQLPQTLPVHMQLVQFILTESACTVA